MNKKIFLCILLALGLPSAAHAKSPVWEFTADDLQHARDADIHAEKDNWDDAQTHAGRAQDSIVADVFAWRKYNAKFGDPSFEQITTFLSRHPDWPEQDKMRSRAELLIVPGTPDNAILNWFSESPGEGSPRFRDPLTGTGKAALAAAILNSELPHAAYTEQTDRWLREGWVNADFTEDTERDFLRRYGARLRPEDHTARIDRLLWDGNVTAAKRILDRTDPEHRKLFNARIHLQLYNFGLEETLNAVPASLKNNDGLLYDRMQWREKKSRKKDMLDIMVQVPPFTAHPRLWWNLRKKTVSTLIDKKKYQLAYLLAKQHSFSDDVAGFADGEWLAGWIALHYLHDPKTAYKHFYQLHKRVETPISAGRAAYWAGRASEMSGYADIAKQWFMTCSNYPSSFYGQLGMQKVGITTISLPAQAEPTPADEERYRSSDLVKAASLLYQLREHGLARLFLAQGIRNAKTVGEKRLIAEFGNSLSRPDYTTFAAKEAARNRGPLILNAYYPSIGVNLKGAGGKTITQPEIALIHAIILQESIFVKDAESSAGALGLMQLMPATARHIAKKEGIPFRKQSLAQDPLYNITLGSAYLENLVEQYDGSYVLAVAAYNGGPGNVAKWIKQNGDPRTMKSTEAIVDWVENIPFAETQNYIQRVLENLQLYRVRLNPGAPATLATAQDIARRTARLPGL